MRCCTISHIQHRAPVRNFQNGAERNIQLQKTLGVSVLPHILSRPPQRAGLLLRPSADSSGGSSSFRFGNPFRTLGFRGAGAGWCRPGPRSVFDGEGAAAAVARQRALRPAGWLQITRKHAERETERERESKVSLVVIRDHGRVQKLLACPRSRWRLPAVCGQAGITQQPSADTPGKGGSVRHFGVFLGRPTVVKRRPQQCLETAARLHIRSINGSCSWVSNFFKFQFYTGFVQSTHQHTCIRPQATASNLNQAMGTIFRMKSGRRFYLTATEMISDHLRVLTTAVV